MLLVKLSLPPLSVLNCRYETDKIAHSVLIGKSAVILIPFASELGFLSRPLGAMLLHPQSSICPVPQPGSLATCRLGSVGTRRAITGLGMNKHRSKWPGQKSEFGRERNQNNCTFFNLKTGCAIYLISTVQSRRT